MEERVELLDSHSEIDLDALETAFSAFQDKGAVIHDPILFLDFLLSIWGGGIEHTDTYDRLYIDETTNGFRLCYVVYTECFHDGGIESANIFIELPDENGLPRDEFYVFRTRNRIEWTKVQGASSLPWFFSRMKRDWTSFCEEVYIYSEESTYQEFGETQTETHYYYLLCNPIGAAGKFLMTT